MLKTLSAASALVFILCAPALAQPTPAPVAAPKPVAAPRLVVAAPPMRVELTVKVGNEKRVHQVVVSDESCGTVHVKSRDFEDQIHVCSVSKQSGTRLEANWRVRDKANEYQLTYTAAVAPGGSVDTFTHGATFTLAMK